MSSALITGASSGIGRELAILFAQDGYQLVLVARSEEALRQLADELRARYNVTVAVVAKDLARSAAAQEIAGQLEQARWTIDVLVNNAGFTAYGPFAAADLNAQLGIIQVNITSLTQLAGLLLPGMVARKQGRILNVASTAGFAPGPLMAVYYATKAYVLSFSEALAEELHGSGVTVTTLCPGPTATNFQARAGLGPMWLLRGRIMDASTVARAGFAGLMRGQRLVIPGIKNVLMTWAIRVTPRSLVARVVRLLQERRPTTSSR